VKTAASGVEHFATSWQKIWFNGLKFDEEAIEVFNRKQLELQGYIVGCIKQYQKDHPGEEINGYTRLPLLPVPDEVAIEGQKEYARCHLTPRFSIYLQMMLNMMHFGDRLKKNN